MINYEKLYRLKAQVEEMAEVRRARGERYRAKISASKALRTEAVLLAHPEFQTWSLASLLTLSPDELRDAGVEPNALQRAALERRQADELLKTGRGQDAAFDILATLVNNLCDHAGEPRP